MGSEENRVFRVLSVGGYSPLWFPPFIHGELFLPDPVKVEARRNEPPHLHLVGERPQTWEAFSLRPLQEEGWEMLVRDMGMCVPDAALSNRRCYERAVEQMELAMHSHDLLLLGYQGGDGARCLLDLPYWVRQHTVLVRWGEFSRREIRALKRLNVLRIRSRETLMDWLLAYVRYRVRDARAKLAPRSVEESVAAIESAG